MGVRGQFPILFRAEACVNASLDPNEKASLACVYKHVCMHQLLQDDYAVELIVDRMAYYDREKKRPNDKVLTDKGGSEKEDNTEGTVILKKLECVEGGEKCTPPEGVKDRLKSNLSSSFK